MVDMTKESLLFIPPEYVPALTSATVDNLTASSLSSINCFLSEGPTPFNPAYNSICSLAANNQIKDKILRSSNNISCCGHIPMIERISDI